MLRKLAQVWAVFFGSLAAVFFVLTLLSMGAWAIRQLTTKEFVEPGMWTFPCWVLIIVCVAIAAPAACYLALSNSRFEE